MLKPLKLSHPEYDIWVVSDTHFAHNRGFIYGPRGFASVEEHDQTLIQRWNAHLTDRSVVLHLGDFCFSDPDGSRFKSLIRRLNFADLYLLQGNHTSGHRQVYIETLRDQFPDAVSKDNQIAYEVYPLVHRVDNSPTKRVLFLPEYAEVSVGQTRLILCHYPIVSHNGMSKQSIHLTGHSHGACALTNKDAGTGLRLDCGIESFGRPISLVEVKQHLKGRGIDSPDHHGHIPPSDDSP